MLDGDLRRRVLDSENRSEVDREVHGWDERFGSGFGGEDDPDSDVLIRRS